MDYKPTLEVLQGLPASGKTTHAKKLVQQGNWVRVNKDDLRAMMDESVHSKSNEKRVIRTRNTIVIDALANGKNVVVDDTNLNPIHIRDLKALADNFDANFHVTFFDTPLEDCLERNAKREKRVPDSVIWDMYNKYLKPPAVEEEESDEELEECIIVDVDGTLAHVTGDNPRDIYDASRADEDELDDAVSSVVGMAYKHGYKVIIVTGRNGEHLDVTKKWLKDNGVNYDEIYSRNELDIDSKGNQVKDTIVKKRIYETHIKKRFKVKYVIDDRPSVCRMWRELGLFTFQVGDPHVEF